MSRRKHTPLCHQQHSPFLACSILEPREHESGIIFVEHAQLVVRKLFQTRASSPAQSLDTAGSVMTIGLSAINGILYLKKKQFDERKPD